jgi:uncharacterized DUF497 family protein
MEFEWDERKAVENLQKHGIDFLDAIAIFLDPYRLEGEDEWKEYGELRLKTIGMVEGRLLVVVYTLRQERIRMISARKAERAPFKSQLTVSRRSRVLYTNGYPH